VLSEQTYTEYGTGSLRGSFKLDCSSIFAHRLRCDSDNMKHRHQSSMVEIVKPAVDKLNYRCLTLDNGIRIILISDAGADKAAAAMDVSFVLLPVGFRDSVVGLSWLQLA